MARRWTPGEIETLRAEYARGTSLCKIAELLGRSYWEVHGQLKHGQPKYHVKLNHGGAKARERAVDLAPPAAAAGRHPEPAPKARPARPTGALVRVRVCEWIGDERGAPGWPSYCGAPVAPGRPYCAAHCARAYRTYKLDLLPRYYFVSPPAARLKARP